MYRPERIRARGARCLAALAAALLLLGSGTAARAQNSPGAIWSTDSTGTVQVNLFAERGDVYLNGGPVKEGAAGLADGEYGIQIASPEGTLLGSSLWLADQTPIVVSGGEFALNYKLWDIVRMASNHEEPGFDLTTNADGVYKIWVSQNLSFPPNESKTNNFKIASGNGQPGVSGTKFYDANVDGVFDFGEAGIGGVRIQVYVKNELGEYVLLDNGQGYTVATDPDGTYWVPLDPGTEFIVCEVLPGTGEEDCWWMQTAPELTVDGDRCYRGTMTEEGIATLHFGNVCLCEPTGGYTKGYWTNKNGKAVLDANPDWLGLINALNLRNADGSDADFASYDQFKAWLSGATAENMACMLSAQLAANVLNTAYKGLSADTVVLLTPELAECYGANVARIGDVQGLANQTLGNDGFTPSGDPLRHWQECLKDILDGINNNDFPFVHDGPCAVVYP